jgi:hypothetical protein
LKEAQPEAVGVSRIQGMGEYIDIDLMWRLSSRSTPQLRILLDF